VKLRSSLLHKLSDLVMDKQYFITGSNLREHFPEEASLTTCNSLQNLADVSFLLNWIVTNYVGRCAQCYSTYVLSEDICSSKQ